ncbi:MAG: Imm1 family immunity protein [Micropepsaceae bacterium]
MRFIDFGSGENPRQNSEIASGVEAVAPLELSRSRRPSSFVELRGLRYELLIGLASDVGCIQASLVDSGGPYEMAVVDGSVPLDDADPIEFDMQGEPTPVRLRFIVPIDTLKSIVREFVDTQEKPDSVVWEMI